MALAGGLTSNQVTFFFNFPLKITSRLLLNKTVTAKEFDRKKLSVM